VKFLAFPIYHSFFCERGLHFFFESLLEGPRLLALSFPLRAGGHHGTFFSRPCKTRPTQGCALDSLLFCGAEGARRPSDSAWKKAPFSFPSFSLRHHRGGTLFLKYCYRGSRWVASVECPPLFRSDDMVLVSFSFLEQPQFFLLACQVKGTFLLAERHKPPGLRGASSPLAIKAVGLALRVWHGSSPFSSLVPGVRRLPWDAKRGCTASRCASRRFKFTFSSPPTRVPPPPPPQRSSHLVLSSSNEWKIVSFF